MKVITNIEIIDSNKNYYNYKENIIFKDYFERPIQKEDIETKTVYGKTFINSEGEEIVLAIPRHLQKIIGLPFEVFRDQNYQIKDLNYQIKRIANNNIKLKDDIIILKKDNNKLKNNIEKLKIDIDIINNLSFLKKIRYLFGCYKL